MGKLEKYFRNVWAQGAQVASSFDPITEEEFEEHLAVSRYGDFELTDAVRPSYDLQVVPRSGYRHDVYRDEETRSIIPVLIAAATREKVFELFLDSLEPLGPVVDVVLETSHGSSDMSHQDLYREHIDLPVLKSICYEYEDLLLNDGCTGIAVLNPSIPLEVQFDEHNLVIVYGEMLREFERILGDVVSLDEDTKFITEAEHVHCSSDEYAQQFEELKMRLGMDTEW